MHKELIEGYRYQREGDYDKALEAFNHAAVHEGPREIALLEVAKTYKMAHRLSDARRSLIYLIGIDPANNAALDELLEVSGYVSEYAAAENVLSSLAEKNPYALLVLAKVYFRSGKSEEAMRALEKYDQKAADDPAAELLRGQIHAARGEFERGHALIEKSSRALPEDFDALFALGEVSQRLQRIPEAIAAFEKAAALRQDQRSYLKLAELYRETGESEKAQTAGRRYIDRAPDTIFDRDAALNRLEILEKKTVLASKVKRLWVTLTTRCNIHCKTCGVWQRKWDLPDKAADEVIALYPYLERVVWLGGEVFLYKRFEEMFEKAARYPNLKQHVITNGVILTERWIERIAETRNTEVAVSIDGASKEVYENIRRGAKFEMLLANVRKLVTEKKKRNAPLDLRLNAVIMKSNYHQMEDLIEFAHAEGFNQVSFMALHFDLAPEENIFYENNDPGILAEINAKIPRIKNKAREYGIELDLLLPCESAGEPEKKPAEKRTLPARRIQCTMPWQYMMICDNGPVLLTGSCVEPVGNISTQSLAEIWNGEPAQKYRQRMIANDFDGICRPECASRWE